MMMTALFIRMMVIIALLMMPRIYQKAFVNIMLFRMLRLNIDDVLKNAHEKAISDLDDANEFTNFSNLDIAEGITRNCNLLW